MKKEFSPVPNPSLKPLELLVGDWDTELSNAAFLPSSSHTVTGHVSFAWLEGGAFLIMYIGNKPPGTPHAMWLISRDESRANYTVLYYDTRKVSRVYEMSFSNGVWRIWRNSPGFSQRFEGKFSEDASTISARWEKSNDGSTWEHDFDVTYRRVK
jgi:hypothetical protein